MPKELFNQTLIGASPNVPDDNDRIALGQPSVSGGRNWTWANLKAWVLAQVSNNFDFIKLNPDSGVTLTEEGQIKWNDKFYTPEYESGLGYTVTIGNQTYLIFLNDTGALIPSGKVMHLVGGALFGGELYPTFEYADPRDWEKVQGTLGMTLHTVANGALGLLAKDAQKINVDTSGVAAGAQMWIKPDGSGDITDIKPQFPDIAISIGGSYDSAVNGCMFFNITSDINQLFDDAWDGAIIEGFDFLVSSDGATITGTLANKDVARNLPIQFSTGFYTFDTTPAATITLTAGTDENPQQNYIYILESTKALTVSTSGFPLVEHAKVGQIALFSAVRTQTNGGAIRNQNITDHIKTTGDNGHILHIAERIRQFNAEWDNGTEGTLDATGGNGYIAVTGGEVWQLHKQSFPSLDMAVSDNIRIVNDFTTAYRETTNLNTITAYSDGSSWSNEWSKIVVWGVCNKSGEASFLMCNIPSDGYNSEANAIADALNYADYSIPETFKGVGFLIGAFAIRISGGSITYNGGAAYSDLRGFIPNNVAGGGSGGGGVTSFTGLTDTPNAYTSQAGKYPRVNDAENALEFTDIKLSRYHNIVVTDTFFNTTDVTTNALYTTDEATFKMPYDGTIEEVIVGLKSIDSGVAGNLNIKIKGQAGNVLNSALSLSAASASDGSGGNTSTDVNLSNNAGSAGDEVLFYLTAGANADAGNGFIYIKIKES